FASLPSAREAKARVRTTQPERQGLESGPMKRYDLWRWTPLAWFFVVLGSWPEACPAQSSDLPMRIDFDVKVSMRDGTKLSADIYRPADRASGGTGRYPVILIRTPYNKSTGRGNHLEWGRFFAAHGYVYVAMDVRGRGDSEGVFVPYRQEGPDG